MQLIKAGRIIEKTVTDAFGDFKFDGLPADSGAYQVGIGDPGRGGQTVDVNLGKGVSVGTVWIG